MICSLFFGQDFVAGEIVAVCVVRADTCGVPQRLKGLVRMVTVSVFEEQLHVSGSKVTHQTAFLILDFLGGEFVFVVLDRRVKEALVEGGLEVQLKVGHDSRGVTISILVVNSDKSVVGGVQLFVFHLGGREFEQGHCGADTGGHPHKRKGAELYTYLITTKKG